MRGLLTALQDLAPNLVVVSGDLTQRARRSQFRAARRFLDSLQAPWLAVPGNHDIPLFDLVRRLVRPRARFNRWITADPSPAVVLPGVRVLGLDSTRRRTAGRLPAARLEALAALAAGEPGDLRVVVTHHPIIPRHVEEVAAAREAAALARVDVLLAGHLHRAWRRRIREEPGQGILLVQAGTATARRLRADEPRNSFNALRWDGEGLAVATWTWEGSGFVPRDGRRFVSGDHGWRAV